MREFPHWLLGYDVFFTIGLLVYPTVGALVASRRPHNPIGWIFCGIGFLYAAQSFAVAYGDYSLVVRHGVGVHAQHVPAAIDFGALAGVKIMAWLSSWIGSDPVALIGGALLFLLFPNGRLLSSSWRPVMWTAVGAGATFLVVYTFTPGPLDTFPFITNPVGIGGTVGHILGMLGNIGLVVLLIALLASAVSLILRLRRAKGVERQQLKWFVYAATLATIGTVVAFAGAYVFASDLINAIGYWETQLAVAALPVFTGLAILRYRLYDIDHIINRTLVYGLLTILFNTVGSGLLRHHNGAPRDRQPSVPGSIPRLNRPELSTRNSSCHPGYGCLVQPLEAPYPVVHRPQLLQKEVRCQKDPRRVLTEAARRN